MKTHNTILILLLAGGLAATAQAPAAPGTASPQFTGERVTLNLKNADLQDFFRLINEISGLNIVIDPNVKGNVTLALTNVPWDQALDIVLRNNGLGEQVEGNVVRIARLSTLADENREAAQLARTREDAAPLVTSYRTLSYTKATDVAQLLNNSHAASAAGAAPSGGGVAVDTGTAAGTGPQDTAGYGLLCARCTVTADPRTNTLVLQSPPEYLPKLDALLAQLDRKTPQVEVEARIVETTNSFSQQLGVQLGISAGSATTALSGLNALGNSPIVVSGLNPSYPTSGGTVPWTINLPASAPTSGLGFIDATNSYRIDAALSAAEARGLGKVLSRPQVVTQNNAQAVTEQGVKIPVQTTINNTISVQFFNVTLRLTVTPQITADGNIFLAVDIENDQIDPSIGLIQGIPAVDTQRTTTNVLVQDGGTVVIGGVMITNSQKNTNQVPVLGDLPLLGNAFKSTQTTKNTQELMFFLTPRVLPTTATPAAAPGRPD